MGKRIISQARGKGSMSYRVRARAFVYEIKYPPVSGEGKIVKLISSPAHSAPLAKIEFGRGVFFNPAFEGASEGQEISIGNMEVKNGNVFSIKDMPIGTNIYNIERNPGDGGKMIRSAGSRAVINKRYENNKVGVLMPNKNELRLDGNCRATIGIVAGEGRKLKPFINAGKKFFEMKARNKLWPRTSAVKMNAIDHPFGSGRGKRIKSKIAKRNAPAGARVGHIRPRRTGRSK
ncbi:MAG: 50S ribosomal protein L2 [Nanoarchaeota archaeon]